MLEPRRDKNKDKKCNMRDYASISQLLVLANMESYNSILINQKKSQEERMKLLRELVIQQLTILEEVNIRMLPQSGQLVPLKN